MASVTVPLVFVSLFGLSEDANTRIFIFSRVSGEGKINYGRLTEVDSA